MRTFWSLWIPQGTQGKNTVLVVVSMRVLNSTELSQSGRSAFCLCSLRALDREPWEGDTSQEVGDLRGDSRTERGCLNLPGLGELLRRGVWLIFPKPMFFLLCLLCSRRRQRPLQASWTDERTGKRTCFPSPGLAPSLSDAKWGKESSKSPE